MPTEDITFEAYIRYVYFDERGTMQNYDGYTELFYAKSMLYLVDDSGTLSVGGFLFDEMNKSLSSFQRRKSIYSFVPAITPQGHFDKNIMRMYYYHDVNSSRSTEEMKDLYGSYYMETPIYF